MVYEAGPVGRPRGHRRSNLGLHCIALIDDIPRIAGMTDSRITRHEAMGQSFGRLALHAATVTSAVAEHRGPSAKCSSLAERC